MKLDSRARFWLASFAVGSAMTAFAVVGMTIGLNLQETRIEIPVSASASAWSDTLSAATGPIDEEVEGLFTLDALTGDLQCAVLNGRTTKFAGLFRTNVLNALQSDASKQPNYIILTGNAMFPGQGGNVRPGNCVVYVIDSTSGRFAVYGVPWQRSLAARGAPQSGALLLLDTGTARNVVIRD